MSLLDKIRFQYGLKWAGKLPSMADIRNFIHGLGFAFLLLLAYGAVAQIDDLAERVIVMEQVADIYEAKVSAMEACEQGAQGYFYKSTGKVFECAKPL